MPSFTCRLLCERIKHFFKCISTCCSDNKTEDIHNETRPATPTVSIAIPIIISPVDRLRSTPVPIFPLYSHSPVEKQEDMKKAKSYPDLKLSVEANPIPLITERNTDYINSSPS